MFSEFGFAAFCCLLCVLLDEGRYDFQQSGLDFEFEIGCGYIFFLSIF